MKISVCIASVRSHTLDAAIQSVRRQTWTDWELVVVGQGADETVRAACAAAAREDARVRYVHIPQRGLGHARNAGLRAAMGEIVAMTDDDCEAREDWLATLAERFDAEPDLGLVGGALVSPPWPPHGFTACPAVIPAEVRYDPVAADRRAPAGFGWTGGNFAIRRRVAERIGEFDACLGAGTQFPAGEDTDYLLRLEAAGIVMRSTPRSVVTHTYGIRRGWRAVYNHSRNYALGNGALAAKLTLMGDIRGQEWLDKTRHECTWDCLPRRLHRLPIDLLRLHHFMWAYRVCLAEFEYDVARGVLKSHGAAETPRAEAAA